VSKFFVEMTLQSTHNQEHQITTKFNVVKSLPSSPAPDHVSDVKTEPHLQGLPIADPDFEGRLDILIGGLDHDNCILGSRTSQLSSVGQ